MAESEDSELRAQLKDELKKALREKETRATSTIRLIMAALKDRDIAARSKGKADGIADDEIRQMLHSMIKQRRDSITLYEQGGRAELAEQEREEIRVIERFLPRQLDEDEIHAAVREVIGELGAASIKEMGRVMGALKSRYAGQMDFARASQMVKTELTGAPQES